MGFFTQSVINGLVLGVQIAALALGFALIWNVTRAFHFAHGSVFALAGYIVYSFFDAGMFWLGVAVALVAAPATGVVMDRLVYRHIQQRDGTVFTVLIGAIGLELLLQAIVGLGWGSFPLYITVLDTRTVARLDSAVLTNFDVLAVAVSLALIAAALGFLHWSRTGKALSATMDEPGMAALVGIDVGRMRTWSMIIGSALVVPAAVFTGMRTGLIPLMGVQPLLLAFSGVLVGGTERVWMGVAGALILALLANLSTLVVPAFLGIPIGLMVVVVVLLFRPTGLFGSRPFFRRSMTV